MIYTFGLRLGATDFTNVAESNAIAVELKRELALSASNCFLCMLQAHSSHEEKDFFAPLRQFDEDPIRLMMAEHSVIIRRVYDVAKLCEQLVALTDASARIEAGDRIVLEANDLFAFYLAHLNNEEALLVPVMWEHFTDTMLRALRAQFYNRIPLPLFEEWMRWTLPALNVHELVVLLSGMKSDPRPNRFADAIRVGDETVEQGRWAQVLERVGR